MSSRPTKSTFRPTLSFSLSTRINLLWVKGQSAVYKSLSFPVLREVCSYIGLIEEPIAVLKDRVLLFNIELGAWQELRILTIEINVSAYSVTFIEQGGLFLLGGNPTSYSGTSHVDAYLLEKNGAVCSLPNMRIGRKAPGVVYDPFTFTVYVFGGYRNGGIVHTGLLSCEKFSCTHFQWAKLPKMNVARCQFNPCIHLSVIYLCGGRATSAETYNPQTNVFALLFDFTLPQNQFSITVVDESGNLVVLSKDYIYKWNGKEKNFALLKQTLVCPTWSSCTPVVRGGLVYVVAPYQQVCRGINLATGAMKIEVEIRHPS